MLAEAPPKQQWDTECPSQHYESSLEIKWLFYVRHMYLNICQYHLVIF